MHSTLCELRLLERHFLSLLAKMYHGIKSCKVRHQDTVCASVSTTSSILAELLCTQSENSLNKSISMNRLSFRSKFKPPLNRF